MDIINTDIIFKFISILFLTIISIFFIVLIVKDIKAKWNKESIFDLLLQKLNDEETEKFFKIIEIIVNDINKLEEVYKNIIEKKVEKEKGEKK